MPTKTYFHIAVNPQYDVAEQLEHAVAAASVYLATEYDDADIEKLYSSVEREGRIMKTVVSKHCQKAIQEVGLEK